MTTSSSSSPLKSPKPHLRLRKGLWECFIRGSSPFGRIVGWSALGAESAYNRWRELMTERTL